ncbi:DUF7344 domain-containing protein [Natronosalvus vescus]|uniref:DUF7344 domain-containing protein n=1 Tax=Natronosalvus vescus TaxID=2953881 RepID=UPI003CCD50C7
MSPKWRGPIHLDVNVPPNDTDTQTAVHRALACAYRRRVVEYLAGCEGDVATVDELIANLHDHDEVTENRRHIAVKLHHVALPKLATLGFLEYDDRSQTVRYRESPVLERELRRCVDVTAVT